MKSVLTAACALLASSIAAAGLEVDVSMGPLVRPGVATSISPEAQIRLGRPVGSETPAAGEIVEGIDPAGLLSLARDVGLTEADYRELKENKAHVVHGRMADVPVAMTAFECESGTCKGIGYWGNFGKQSDVTQDFIMAFNLRHAGKLVVDGDGELALLATHRYYGGVRREHLVYTGQFFARLIRVAIEFKP